MIQRVQTIWLLISSVVIFLTLRLPSIISGDPFITYNATDSFLIMVFTCALGTATFINIFLFKHRIVQFRICIFSILLECGIIALYFWQLKKFPSGAFGIWAVLHAFVLIALVMAARGIYKDEKLVKDSNRLR